MIESPFFAYKQLVVNSRDFVRGKHSPTIQSSHRIFVSAENNAYCAWQSKLFYFSSVTRLNHQPIFIVHDSGCVWHPDFDDLVCRAYSSQAISAGEPLTICEDDAIFSHFFEDDAERILAMLPPGWDIILWGWNYDTTLHFYMGPPAFPSPCSVQFDEDQLRLTAGQFQPSAMNSQPFRLTGAYGTICYTISPPGAKKLLEHCGPRFAPLDIMLNKAYARMNSFVSFPPLVITKNEHGSSTVQLGSRHNE